MQCLAARYGVAPATPAGAGSSVQTQQQQQQQQQPQSELGARLDDLMLHYVTIEKWYLEQSVLWAIKIDTHAGAFPFAPTRQPGRAAPLAAAVAGAESAPVTREALVARFSQSLTSTVAEDVFHILRRCGERAIESCSVLAAGAVLEDISTVLTSHLRPHFLAVFGRYAAYYGQGRPAEELAAAVGLSVGGALPPQEFHATGAVAGGGGGGVGGGVSALAATLSSVEDGMAKTQLAWEARALVALNNLSACAQHTATLRDHLLKMCEVMADTTRTVIINSLDALAGSAAELSALLKKGIHVVAATVTPRLKPLIEKLNAANYLINEKQFQGT
jgi:hypothetical protein